MPTSSFWNLTFKLSILNGNIVLNWYKINNSKKRWRKWGRTPKYLLLNAICRPAEVLIKSTITLFACFKSTFQKKSTIFHLPVNASSHKSQWESTNWSKGFNFHFYPVQCFSISILKFPENIISFSEPWKNLA